MPTAVLCKICGKRRARRACPAVEGDICSICCGTEREVSLACPLTCEYLQEAHKHETAHRREDAHSSKALELPYPEIDVGALDDHRETMPMCAYALFEAAMRTSGAIDRDALEALDAEIRTQRTAQSGLVYATKPENFVAQAVQRHFSQLLDELQKQRVEHDPLSGLRPVDLLHALVFLYRLGSGIQNGRPRGRAFLDFLRHTVEPVFAHERSSSDLIIESGGLLL